MVNLKRIILACGLTGIIGIFSYNIYRNANFTRDIAEYVLIQGVNINPSDENKLMQVKSLKLTDLVSERTKNPYDVSLEARSYNNRLVSLTARIKIHLTNEYLKSEGLTNEDIKILGIDSTRTITEIFAYDFTRSYDNLVAIQKPQINPVFNGNDYDKFKDYLYKIKAHLKPIK